MLNTINYNNYSSPTSRTYNPYFGKKSKVAEKIMNDVQKNIFSKHALKDHPYSEQKKKASRIRKFVKEILVPRLEETDLTCKELAQQFKEMFSIE